MQQDFLNYSIAQHQEWSTRYLTQSSRGLPYATDAFKAGLWQLGLRHETLPDLQALAPRVRRITGWELVPVTRPYSFLEKALLWADKKFPVRTYLDANAADGDIFTDVFAQLPLLTNSDYASLLHFLGLIALAHADNPLAIYFVERFAVRTLDYGLVKEFGRNKLLGRFLLDGKVAPTHALQATAVKRARLEPSTAMAVFLETDIQLPTLLFVAENLEQLSDMQEELGIQLKVHLLTMLN